MSEILRGFVQIYYRAELTTFFVVMIAQSLGHTVNWQPSSGHQIEHLRRIVNRDDSTVEKTSAGLSPTISEPLNQQLCDDFLELEIAITILLNEPLPKIFWH